MRGTVQIAYVTETYPPEVNGVALTTARAVEHLRAAGHRVLLVRPRQRGEAARDDADEWRCAGGPIPMYPELRYGLATRAALRRRWRAAAPALVHVATPGPLALAALSAARAEGIATSADFRTNFHAYSRHYRLGWLEPLVLRWLRRLHDQADCNFVPTAALAAELAAAGFARLSVSGRGVDARLFDPARRDPALRARWVAAEGDPVLLHVGRLAPEKNVALALAAWERLRATRPGLRMVVVGDGPQRAALQRRHPQACFAGVHTGEALARHYASADAFAFPSLTDTFGNVTLEALASGLAYAGFDTAAAAVHVVDGVNGCLARPGDVAAFEATLAAALAQAEPGSALRRRARETALSADWSAVLQRFESTLCGVAERRAAGPIADAALA
ncbi:glycosyltransferase family 4 protein [Rubrivivax gelatinosus]|uniref:glycosyltransferase family 4 protein n=1 Tax=Rubrivivax gelatinosus TaxID=28068 RepID=UPI001E60E0D6|nr:glycosyltransferase family 1 protein [Rubrivivax gelatinosus]